MVPNCKISLSCSLESIAKVFGDNFVNFTDNMGVKEVMHFCLDEVLATLTRFYLVVF